MTIKISSAKIATITHLDVEEVFQLHICCPSQLRDVLHYMIKILRFLEQTVQIL